ncbi:hypothetical protein DASC09_010340 [Saccharomycopsis crataegensis]|uniref:Major facilitator superfamily (MFS) profile domain-containing protein n=1 Tax=Saccharomycopsis crataegensis TaxID=43959 RepID=A0AAV5QGC2_9ASCO|nr:hypothetical protein DASC09_010340 [Saccharomycopsis crataegensis]
MSEEQGVSTANDIKRSYDPENLMSEEDFYKEKTDDVVKTRGVTRIEAVKSSSSRTYLWIFGLSIFLTAWVATLDNSTTYNYQPYATSSFGRHSMLSTLTIANSVISAVCKPFIAKIADFTSRPTTYIVVIVLYVIGFIVTACSPNISAYVIGSVFISIGQSGIDLMNSIVVGDMISLKWRSFMLSILAMPYLVTTWVSGYIVEQIVATNWRWGYGMFTIITPVALIPAVMIMYWLDHKANSQNKIPIGSDPFLEKKRTVAESQKSSFKAWCALIEEALIEIDAIGLLLIGFGFSLILLPCSLYPYAVGGWSNPSMIAMEVVGGVLIIMYVIYEIWIAPFPLLPKRVLFNRTFICCVIIDFIYQLGGYFPLLYFTSYTMVVLDLSTQDWVYFSNTVTMGLCFFGIVWGIVFRIFHRYKVFQVVGICIKLIGMGLYVKAGTYAESPGIGVLIAGLIITSFGDAANVMGTQIAAQAAVPHQDMAATISVLSLYSSIGAAIGTAITAAIWNSKMPGALLKYVPDATKATEFFESVSDIHAEPWGSANRLGAIKAYQEVNHVLFCMGVGVSSIMLIGVVFQSNFYLGDQQNCVEGEQKESYQVNEDGSKKSILDKIADFFNKPLY